MTAVLREPFVHLLALGALVFGLYSAVGSQAPQTGSEVVVDGALLDSIRGRFHAQSKRDPSDQELVNAVHDHVRSEILYREGLAMGFDQDDVIIRRRVVQKMQFLAADLAEARGVEEAQVRAHYDAHPETYVVPPRVSFRQLHFSADAHQGKEFELASALLTRLRGGELDFSAARAQADRSMLPPELDNAEQRELARSFGQEFASQVSAARAPGLLEPVRSSYGTHVVEVMSLHAQKPLPFELAKKDILTDLEHGQRKATEAKLYKRLRTKYRVSIEGVVLPGLQESAL